MSFNRKHFEEEGTSVWNCAAVQIDISRQEKMNETILLSLLDKKLRERILQHYCKKNACGNIFVCVSWSARMNKWTDHGQTRTTMDEKGGFGIGKVICKAL